MRSYGSYLLADQPTELDRLQLQSRVWEPAGRELLAQLPLRETIMEIIRRAEVQSLVNGGVTSEQLLFPENSKSERVTITRVTVAPGAKSPRHTHAASEQAWVALQGSGTLLLAESATAPFNEGDVVRFAEGDIHGLENTGPVDFVYVSVTAPPVNFRAAYTKKWGENEGSQ